MSDRDMLIRIQSFLAAAMRGERSTPEQTSAWADFYLIHDPIVRGIAKRCESGPSEVDDLSQDVWVLLIRKLPKLKLDSTRGTLHAWVAAVARHHAGRYARGRLRRHDLGLTPELAAGLPDPATDPITETERKQQQEQVRAMIAKLGENEPDLIRQITVRYWIGEQSMAEISAELAASEERVRWVVRRASPRLLELLRRAGLAADIQKESQNFPDLRPVPPASMTISLMGTGYVASARHQTSPEKKSSTPVTMR